MAPMTDAIVAGLGGATVGRLTGAGIASCGVAIFNGAGAEGGELVAVLTGAGAACGTRSSSFH